MYFSSLALPKRCRHMLAAALVMIFSVSQSLSQVDYDALNPPKIAELLADQPMTRAGRPFTILATITNPSENVGQCKC